MMKPFVNWVARRKLTLVRVTVLLTLLSLVLTSSGLVAGEGGGGAQPPAAPAASSSSSALAQDEFPFDVVELTIADIHDALEAGEVTCRELVRTYLLRISTYDQNGPQFNSIITINPDALELAEAIDEEDLPRSEWKPLHCIPVIIKDLMNTDDRMPTTGGHIGLAGMITPDDAFIVEQMREAGAIILAKANLDELARGIWGASGLGGQTHNAYDTSVNPSGSSSGTGVALAANFGAVGIGTDTCGSIRNPSAFQSLVGVRPTLGLVSRTGVIPDAPSSDTAGPMARTVTDTAVLLDVIAGVDEDDPQTLEAEGNIPDTYTKSLKKNGLRGARVGVIRAFFGTGPEADKVTEVMDAAIAEMEALGATVIDPVEVLHSDDIVEKADEWGRWTWENGDALDAYLEGLGDAAPLTYAELREIGTGAPLIFPLPETGLTGTPEHLQAVEESTTFTREAVLTALEEHRLDALVYPTLSQPPAPIGEFQEGDNCGLSAWSGFPAITVPAGFTEDGHPVGLEMIAEAWSEPKLIELAYGFEQGTHHRRPPELAP
jgi:Asp-tRNA(Asn)/Glu-tRNA(Gln) amidotransferase A subunit family amidase